MVEKGSRYRHVKSGGEYEVVALGRMQTRSWSKWVYTDEEPVDMEEVVVYRSLSDGLVWVRPVDEFEDGRFERIKPQPLHSSDLIEKVAREAMIDRIATWVLMFSEAERQTFYRIVDSLIEHHKVTTYGELPMDPLRNIYDLCYRSALKDR